MSGFIYFPYGYSVILWSHSHIDRGLRKYPTNHLNNMRQTTRKNGMGLTRMQFCPEYITLSWKKRSDLPDAS
jgi:hypothetical protein